MVLSVMLHVLFAIAVCVLALRAAMNVLGLDLMRTLMWLGLAEARPPSRRPSAPPRISGRRPARPRAVLR